MSIWVRFYMLQKQNDDLVDIISYLGNSKAGIESPDGMTVFGFGRNLKPEPLLQGPHSFIIGFYPQKILNPAAHQKFEQHLFNLLNE